MSTLVIAISLLAGLLILRYRNSVAFTPSGPKNVPQLGGGLPLIGNSLQILRRIGDLLHWLLELQETVGKGGRPMTASFLPLGRVVIIARPEYVEHVQKNVNNYPKGPKFYSNVHDVLGDGIFAVDGESWRSQRKLAANLFTANNFRNHVTTVLQKELSILDELLRKLSKEQTWFDLQDVFMRFMLSSFVMMSFDRDLKVLTSDPADLKTVVPFGEAFDYAQSIMERRFVDPTLRIRELFTATGAKQRKSIKIIRDYAGDVIDERVQKKQFKPTDTGEKSNLKIKDNTDLLGLLMEHTTEKGPLTETVINFIIAGRDTTAQALSWTWWYLLQPENAQILHKCRKEIESTWSATELPTYDNFKNLTYVNAVFHETLRLHPSVPKNSKMVVKDDVLPGIPSAGIEPVVVKAGSQVLWSAWVMGRMPEVWGPDATEYKPERWIDGAGQLKKESTFKFNSFNAGPRLCLGQTLATFEGVAILASMIRNFDFTLDPNAEVPIYNNSLTHPIRNPYKVRVRSRA